MAQAISIFLSIIGILAGGSGIINCSSKNKLDVMILVWSIILLASIFLIFISIYSLQSYNQSEKTNKLLKQNNEMLEQILLSLNPDNEYHKRKAQKESDLAKPKEEPILSKDGIQTYQTFLMKRNNSSCTENDNNE